MSFPTDLSVAAHPLHSHIVHLFPSVLTTSLQQAFTVDLRTRRVISVAHVLTPALLDTPQPELQDGVLFAAEDGIRVHVYWCEGAWEVGSTWSPRSVLRDEVLALLSPLPPSPQHIYRFVYCSPSRRVLVRQDQPRLVLESILSEELQEIDLSQHSPSAWARVGPGSQARISPFLGAGAYRRLSPFSSSWLVSPEMVAASLTIGFSNPGFGPMNLAADNLSEEDLVELARRGQLSLLVAYFPRRLPAAQLAQVRLRSQQARLDRLFAAVSAEWEQLKGDNDRKSFAQRAKQGRFKDMMFKFLDEPTVWRASPKLYFRFRSTRAKFYGILAAFEAETLGVQ